MFDAKYELTEALRKARDYAQERADENGGIFCLNDQADYLLANDVEPVVHARWDTIEKEGFWIGQMEKSLSTGRPTKCSFPVCSHCKTEFGTIALEYKRCPECGAKMDLKVKE